MLRWRLLSAAVIVSVLLGIVGLDYQQVGLGRPGVWLAPLLLIITGMAAWEVLGLLHAGGYQPRKIATTIATVAVAASFCGPIIFPAWTAGKGWSELPFAAVTIAILAALAWELPRFRGDGKSLVQSAWAIYTILYIGLLIGFLTPLRLFHSNSWGMLALVSTLTITKFADTGAFVVGKTLGRTKLTPLLSPGKTVEGAIGGIATACLVAWLLQRFLLPWLIVEPPESQAIAWCVYGALLAFAGMLGDLAESLLKREMHQKDSSRWLPGLGGVMDIVDALLFAAPVSWLCWSLGLIGP